ncbi:MAG: histidine phosphatase family protein [Firmicutes bacterium]|nr:histidine phosphatase family protein [Bacillota bacterium]
MEKIIYLIRHSVPMKIRNNIVNSDSLQVWNEKNPLSIIGEEKAREYFDDEEFFDVDYIISSKYVRAISTAKYLAEKNNLNININENFGERKHGVESWDLLPEGFEEKQMVDKEYKVGDGENQLEVASRMYEALMEVVRSNHKKIVVLSHATAITFLLMKICNYSNGVLSFNGEVLIDNSFSWKSPDGFKLVFDDDKLISINHIK